MIKIHTQAQHLQPGDVVGSGETIVSIQAGLRTPKGKVEVVLFRNGYSRLAFWSKHTFINAQRPTDKPEPVVTTEMMTGLGWKGK